MSEEEKLTPEQLIVKLQQSTTSSLDRVFQLVYAAYKDHVEDSEVLYRLFVGVLAQLLGRHVAAFPADQREQIGVEALHLYEEMLELVVRENEPKTEILVRGKTYDLSKLEPQGRA